MGFEGTVWGLAKWVTRLSAVFLPKISPTDAVRSRIVSCCLKGCRGSSQGSNPGTPRRSHRGRLMPELSPDDAKRLAAGRALELVTPGMRLGLGTGTTAAHFVELLAARVAKGLDVICVPTSERTRTQAELYAIPLTTIGALPELDLTVDGADEFVR